MDTSALTEVVAQHKHDAGRPTDRTFLVLLVVSLLVLSSCAVFAVVMTNGPDYRAAAAPGPVPTLSGETATLVGGGADTTLEPLAFTATMADGPIVIGEPGRLVVTIDNPHEHPVLVERLDVQVGDPDVYGCRPEWLRVEEYAADGGLVTVPPTGSARITVAYTLVDLPNVNQDACQGVAFPLSIAGSGTPVP